MMKKIVQICLLVVLVTGVAPLLGMKSEKQPQVEFVNAQTTQFKNGLLKLEDLCRVTNNFTMKNKHDRTVLHLLALDGYKKVYKPLLDKFAELKLFNERDSKGDTALHLAINNGNFDFAGALLKRGALFTIQNNAGKSAEMCINDLGSQCLSNANAALDDGNKDAAEEYEYGNECKKLIDLIELAKERVEREEIVQNQPENKKPELVKTDKIPNPVKSVDQGWSLGALLSRAANGLSTGYLGYVLGQACTEKQVPKKQLLFASSAFLITHLFEAKMTKKNYCKSIGLEKAIAFGAGFLGKLGFDKCCATELK